MAWTNNMIVHMQGCSECTKRYLTAHAKAMIFGNTSATELFKTWTEELHKHVGTSVVTKMEV